MPPLSRDNTGKRSTSFQAPIALTMGDPAGIGPAITQQAWQAVRHLDGFEFFVIGDPQFYQNAKAIDDPAQTYEIFADALPILPIECAPVSLGKPDVSAAPAIIKSIDMAVKFCLEGRASAVVTNPIAKGILYQSGFSSPGHTEYLAELTKDAPAPYARGPVMMLSVDTPDVTLRVALATIHMALVDVKPTLSPKLVSHIARVLHGALTIDFGMENPRISMAGLNPHAGENGAMGREEIEILNPVAEALRAEGITITNAQSADTLFHAEARENYDAVLCMYHDQGLIPVKTLDFHAGVNISLGLPIIRTSPDHGTAFDLAEQIGNATLPAHMANPNSLITAIKTAWSLSKTRAQSLKAN
jgi:4-hydroxythreonine-4-phosphate dehydrogenase